MVGGTGGGEEEKEGRGLNKPTPPPTGISLSAHRLSHRWPDAPSNSFGPLDFEVPAGSLCLLLGPNGCGKTSLLLRLAGLTRGPGQLRLDGVDCTPKTFKKLGSALGFVWANPDDGLLLPVVWEDVALGPCNDGLPRPRAKALALHWLERLGLGALWQSPLRSLSLGQRQAVALAGVLARNPRMLLLDEPLSHLDGGMRLRVLQTLAECGATCIAATHEPAFWKQHWGGRCRELFMGRGIRGGGGGGEEGYAPPGPTPPR